MAKKGLKSASECTAPRTAPRVRPDGCRRPRGDLKATSRRRPWPVADVRADAAPPTPSALLSRHAGAAAGESESERRSPCFDRDDSRLLFPRSQASVRPGVAAPQEHAPASCFTTVPSHRPAVAVDATSARLLDGVEAGLRRRRGVVPVAACARPGGRVSSLAWRETRTISPRRDHEDAARRRAAASNSHLPSQRRRRRSTRRAP